MVSESLERGLCLRGAARGHVKRCKSPIACQTCRIETDRLLELDFRLPEAARDPEKARQRQVGIGGVRGELDGFPKRLLCVLGVSAG